MSIRIVVDKALDMACTMVIMVPEKALDEPGHIRCLAIDQSGHRKHEFHAVTQMALVQFEDRELVPQVAAGKIRVTAGGETLEADGGLLIALLETGRIVLVTNSGQPVRKLLVAAHRFCTRWIRLDL